MTQTAQPETAKSETAQPIAIAPPANVGTRGRALDAAGIALSVVGSAAVLSGGTWAIWAAKRRRTTDDGEAGDCG